PVREDPRRRHGDRCARALRARPERALHLALRRTAPRAAATRPARNAVPVPVGRPRQDPSAGADRAWGAKRITGARRRGPEARRPGRRVARRDPRLQLLSVSRAAARADAVAQRLSGVTRT